MGLQPLLHGDTASNTWGGSLLRMGLQPLLEYRERQPLERAARRRGRR